MDTPESRLDPRAQPWTTLALCAAVVAAGALGHLVGGRPTSAAIFAPGWLPFAAAGLGAAGVMNLSERPRWLRLQPALLWGGLLLMVWAANGLPFDLLRLTPLIPLPVDWPGLAARTLAFAAAVALARRALALPEAGAATRVATWYGYAAFALALPYPVLRTCWALGGTPGLLWPGAAGKGPLPWLACIPWLLAAILSLLLVSASPAKPRRLLLAAGWSATAIVAMIGPAAVWSLVTQLMGGSRLTATDPGQPPGMAAWVPVVLYGSWFLWAIAGGAATRSYQLRSAGSVASSGTRRQVKA